MKIVETAERLTAIKNKFGLEGIDIVILGRLQVCWNFGDETKIMNVIKKLCADVASPASLHHRLTALTDAKFLKIVTDKKDTRVKHIQEGINFKKLEKELWNI